MDGLWQLSSHLFSHFICFPHALSFSYNCTFCRLLLFSSVCAFALAGCCHRRDFSTWIWPVYVWAFLFSPSYPQLNPGCALWWSEAAWWCMVQIWVLLPRAQALVLCEHVVFSPVWSLCPSQCSQWQLVKWFYKVPADRRGVDAFTGQWERVNICFRFMIFWNMWK